MLVGGHGEANPNTNWLQSRGFWLSYCLGILAVHLILLSVPFLTVQIAWTATNVFHNFVHLIFLHTIKGTPWLSQDQGECRRLTHWEQIDNGMQFTSTKKFLSIAPIALFFLTNLYIRYNPVHFYINFISLVVILLPKLPHFHKRLDLPPFNNKHPPFFVNNISEDISLLRESYQESLSICNKVFAAGIIIGPHIISY